MFSKFKILSISIAIPLLFGFIGSLLGDSLYGFETLIKPPFTPPAFVFPIAWTILYILMGISSYIIYTSDNDKKTSALIIYLAQLVANSFWTLLFFQYELLLFSFWWIILIIILVIIMICLFYEIKPFAAYIQFPYLLWLTFAAILNYSIYLIN
jgi:translocator protein